MSSIVARKNCIHVFFSLCLSEFTAPEWATECLIRALPSLTIQYIADSASIELSRDCGAEGIKRLTCNGKQDQDFIQRELMCQLERETITSDNEMRAAAAADAAIAAAAAAADELPSENIDEASQSDNMENNNIDKIANQIEASVDKVNDKFNLDDVMMGDAPFADSHEADDAKPVKNAKKIASEKPLKNQPKQMRKTKTENKDDLMMGDQAVPASVTDEILPHVKKVASDEWAPEITTTPKSVLEVQQTTIEVRSRRETENPVKHNISATTTTTESNLKIESEAARAPHKEITRDHFIPPMLLVQHQNSTPTPTPASSSVGQEATTVTILNATPEPKHHDNQASSTQHVPTTANDLTTISSSVETSSIVLTTVALNNTTDEPATVSTATAAATTPTPTPHEPAKTNIGMRPHAPKFGGEILLHAPTTAKSSSADLTQANHTNSSSETANASEATVITENVSASTSNVASHSTAKPTEAATEQLINQTVSEAQHLEVAKRSNSAVTDKHQHKVEHRKQDTHKHTDDSNATSHHADFTNSNLDYQNYKPNRKRILTKPETHTFIQKVFG